MIVVALIAILAVAGNIWLWRRLVTLDESRTKDRDEFQVAILDTRQQAASLVRDLRRDHQAKTASLYSYLALQLAARDRTLADQAEILRGIVAFLDDVPQNFEFSRAGIHYKMVLPDRLKMSLTRDGS